MKRTLLTDVILSLITSSRNQTILVATQYKAQPPLFITFNTHRERACFVPASLKNNNIKKKQKTNKHKTIDQTWNKQANVEQVNSIKYYYNE